MTSKRTIIYEFMTLDGSFSFEKGDKIRVSWNSPPLVSRDLHIWHVVSRIGGVTACNHTSNFHFWELLLKSFYFSGAFFGWELYRNLAVGIDTVKSDTILASTRLILLNQSQLKYSSITIQARPKRAKNAPYA